MLDATKHISSEAQDYLIDWYTTKPVFGLMGEYSAGKSTLLNLLLDQNALPTKVTATNLPPVWLTYSEVSTCQGLRFDGVLEDVDLNETSEDIRDHYVLLRMGVTSDRLKDADIIDTPGISDPRLEKGALNFLGDYMDFVLWLSAANQAWRQTEKMAWTSFPEILRTNSVMLLTRADKLRNAKDVEKVHKRCRTETAGLFRKIVPLMTTKAAAVADEDRIVDVDSAWVMTGGAALETSIAESLENAIEARETAALVHVPKPKTIPVVSTPKVENDNTGWEAKADTGLQSGENKFSTDISELNQIGGFIGACLVDAETGLMITSEGGDDTLDLEALGAAHTEVVKAKLAAIEMLGHEEQIDDILITLGGQFHLIRPLTDTPTVFICAALDKQAADLEVARAQLEKVEKTVSL